MRLTKFNEVILSEEDILNGLYSGKITYRLDELNVDNPELVEQFNLARKQNADPFPNLKSFEQTIESLEDFDKQNQDHWFMPDEYKNMDIIEFLVDECPKEHYQRLMDEIELFRQHDMMVVLNYLKYLVDTMRENNIVWGVGRGSSVASYCLYLLGVHKVDSIKYELDIHEFLK